MKNFVVYTAIFGNYDDLIEPKEQFEGCDFICFTDQHQLISDIWEIILIEECDLQPNMMNRKYKILPHLFLSKYEQSLYVDANIIILKNPLELANKYLSDFDMAIPKHFERDCLYEEAKECIISRKSKLRQTFKQIEEYKKLGFPIKFGLGENNILLRNHNCENVIKLMNDWWDEMNTHTQRDQLSFSYVLWKNGMKPFFMDESLRVGNHYFDIVDHKYFSNRSLKKRFYDSLRIRFLRQTIKLLSVFRVIKL
jgi:hypothetical protein